MFLLPRAALLNDKTINMVKNKIFLLLLGVLLSMAVYAQKDQFNPVYTGVTSLSIAPDARAGALGDVGAATEPLTFEYTVW